MTFTYAYPRIALTVDVAVLHAEGDTASVLLIERAREPFLGAWALPGGFVEPGERLLQAALRELREETGLSLEAATFVGVCDAPERDPREHTIATAFVALLGGARPVVAPRDDARAVTWAPLDALPSLAFDHATILADAARRAFAPAAPERLVLVTKENP
jgi:8-oxo-dGTP diphosphatase